MPRALNNERFFIYAPNRNGRNKGTQLLGVNNAYKGPIHRPSVQDLLDFLNQQNIKPSEVDLTPSFMTRTFPK